MHKSMLDLHISKLYVRMAGSSRHNGEFMAASEFTDTGGKKKNAPAEENTV